MHCDDGRRRRRRHRIDYIVFVLFVFVFVFTERVLMRVLCDLQFESLNVNSVLMGRRHHRGQLHLPTLL